MENLSAVSNPNVLLGLELVSVSFIALFPASGLIR